MGYQDDYVMRTISDLVRAIARLVLGKNDIDYDLPEDEDKYTDLDRVYKRLKDLVDEGNINDAENLLTDELDTDSLDCLETVSYTHLDVYKRQLFWDTGHTDCREGWIPWWACTNPPEGFPGSRLWLYSPRRTARRKNRWA